MSTIIAPIGLELPCRKLTTSNMLSTVLSLVHCFGAMYAKIGTQYYSESVQNFQNVDTKRN